MAASAASGCVHRRHDRAVPGDRRRHGLAVWDRQVAAAVHHGRRSEARLRFDLAEARRGLHLTGEPREIGGVAVFVASKAPDYVCRTVPPVDGGRLARQELCMDRLEQPFAKNADLAWEPAGEGVSRKVLTYGERAMMVRVRFEKGAVGPLHHHPHIQCSLVESGVFDITVSGRTERLVAGDGFLVPPDAAHGAVAVEAGTLVDVFTPMREDFV